MIRTLAFRLLEDDHGINEYAWRVLCNLLEKEGGNEDIIFAVKAQDSRWFLPTGWLKENKDDRL